MPLQNPLVYSDSAETLISIARFSIRPSVSVSPWRKHPIEYLVDIPELPFQVESSLNLLLREFAANFGIAMHGVAKIGSILPGLHCVLLHQPVRIFAQHAGLR